MPTNTPSLREAWTQIPALGAINGETARFASRRMERIITIAVAIGSGISATQGAVSALTWAGEYSLSGMVLLGVVLLAYVAMFTACLIDRGVRVAGGIFAVVYPLALLMWPLTASHAVYPMDTQPWLFFLTNVATAGALLAFSFRLQAIWVVGGSLLYGWARLAQGGFSGELWTLVGFDVSFILILGIVIIALAWMCRSVAAGVDEARAQAVASYSSAAAEVAAEEERVEIAALMHDSVLAALIAAERAHDERTRDLAVGMSREALTRLADVDTVTQEGSDAPVTAVQIVAELRRTLSEQGADAVVEQRGATPAALPGRAARALVLAARQAIGNAIEHANGRGLHILVEGGDDGAGITITVQDTGPGFDPDALAEDRLGIRASIYARMAGVAGTARIESDSAGTAVILGWRR